MLYVFLPLDEYVGEISTGEVNFVERGVLAMMMMMMMWFIGFEMMSGVLVGV